MPQRQCLRPYGQPTLTLIQMRQQRLELRSQDGLDPFRSPHTRTTIPAAGSHDLFPGKPIVLAGILYKVRTDTPWKYIPSVFGSPATLQTYWTRWRKSGFWERAIGALAQEGSTPLRVRRLRRSSCDA
ncbi:transposase [Streptomyces halstedii]|uniref:transposase n=1 Tax=Streptomyces halstedii TaxID=1944 RepID=UPI003863F1C5